MTKSESFNKNSKYILVSIVFIDTPIIFGLLIISCEKEDYKPIMIISDFSRRDLGKKD